MQIRKDDDGDEESSLLLLRVARIWCESRLTVVIHQLQKQGAKQREKNLINHQHPFAIR